MNNKNKPSFKCERMYKQECAYLQPFLLTDEECNKTVVHCATIVDGDLPHTVRCLEHPLVSAEGPFVVL